MVRKVLLKQPQRASSDPTFKTNKVTNQVELNEFCGNDADTDTDMLAFSSTLRPNQSVGRFVHPLGALTTSTSWLLAGF